MVIFNSYVKLPEGTGAERRDDPIWRTDFHIFQKGRPKPPTR